MQYMKIISLRKSYNDVTKQIDQLTSELDLLEQAALKG